VRVEAAGSGVVLAERVSVASTGVARMRGLLGRGRLEPGGGLLLEPASQVHTFGMKFPIDIVFCDDFGVVLHLIRSMRPRRVSKWVRRARRVLELPAGSLPAEVVVGSKLIFYDGFSKGQ
jgi:uncharacterized membrane protein (UPF0127 family)